MSTLVLSGHSQAEKGRLIRQHVGELLAALAAGTGDDLFDAYLSSSARFHHYSQANVALITLQRRDITRLAGIKTWEAMNRRLRKGCRAVWIWAPRFWREQIEDQESGEITTTEHRHFTVVPVFDAADTVVMPGKEDLYVATFQRDLGDVEPLLQAATAWAKEQGYQVSFRPLYRDLEGLGYAASDGSIAVDDSVPIGQQLHVAVHELAHALQHLNRSVDRALAEGEADATACIVLRHFGYDVTATSAAYLRNHQVSPAMVVVSLQRITDTARSVIDGMEACLDEPDAEASRAADQHEGVGTAVGQESIGREVA